MTDRLFEAMPEWQPCAAFDRMGRPRSVPTLNRAVVAYDNLTTKGMVLWHDGADLSSILDPDLDPGSESLESLGMEEAPHGISVWEGKYNWYSGVNCEGIDEGADFVGKGIFREPTDAEWLAIQKGCNPWNC